MNNKKHEKCDHLQRTPYESILGSVISNNSWDQAWPISKTGAGVWRSPIQSIAAYVISLSRSANIVEQITRANLTHQISFTDLVEEFSIFKQQKFQEHFDKTALSNLLECQTSTREKARLLSFPCLNQELGWRQHLFLLLAYTFNLPSSELLWETVSEFHSIIWIGTIQIVSQLFWTYLKIRLFHLMGVAKLSLVMTEYETQ